MTPVEAGNLNLRVWQETERSYFSARSRTA